MEDLTGKQLGPYRVVKAMGQGGMAAVYKAYQASMDRYVALKILPRHFADDPMFSKRFAQEAKLIAKLEHPHILPVHDFGEADNYTYLVMRLIDGGCLSDLMQRERLLSFAEINKIIREVGSALDYAHSRGVIHRDIKPANVLIDQLGNCLLTDFGVAKMVEGSTRLTQTGGILGTPSYISPEQGMGQQIDNRTDIYSLGVILYQMSVGMLPFEAETPMAVVIKHIHDPLPPPRQWMPDLPETVERVILKSLAKKAADRYATAGEMIAALEQAIEQLPNKTAERKRRPAPAMRPVQGGAGWSPDAQTVADDDPTMPYNQEGKQGVSNKKKWLFPALAALAASLVTFAFFQWYHGRATDAQKQQDTTISAQHETPLLPALSELDNSGQGPAHPLADGPPIGKNPDMPAGMTPDMPAQWPADKGRGTLNPGQAPPAFDDWLEAGRPGAEPPPPLPAGDYKAAIFLEKEGKISIKYLHLNLHAGPQGDMIKIASTELEDVSIDPEQFLPLDFQEGEWAAYLPATSTSKRNKYYKIRFHYEDGLLLGPVDTTDQQPGIGPFIGHFVASMDKNFNFLRYNPFPPPPPNRANEPPAQEPPTPAFEREHDREHDRERAADGARGGDAALSQVPVAPPERLFRPPDAVYLSLRLESVERQVMAELTLNNKTFTQWANWQPGRNPALEFFLENRWARLELFADIFRHEDPEQRNVSILLGHMEAGKKVGNELRRKEFDFTLLREDQPNLEQPDGKWVGWAVQSNYVEPLPFIGNVLVLRKALKATQNRAAVIIGNEPGRLEVKKINKIERMNDIWMARLDSTWYFILENPQNPKSVLVENNEHGKYIGLKVVGPDSPVPQSP